MDFKSLLPIFCGLIATVAPAQSSASVLSPQEALNRVGSNPFLLATRGGESTPALCYTVETSQQQPAVYVFHKNNSQGFLIVSADDYTPALLGYSDSGSFNPDNIPPQLKYWLGEYSRQIQLLREGEVSPVKAGAKSSLPDWKPITPLVESKWNQGDPFNLYCYTIAADGTETKSVTGCVATSMAQVMYYYKYPEIGHGSISYKHEDSGTYSMNFDSQPFEWNEMQPTYYPDSYTSAQADAVAYLMKACGYSVKMNYGKGESGAVGANIPTALINYFGYDDNIVIRDRKFYTYADWTAMIYKNLSECGPVVYDGSALDGGHSFVCDGYDGNGYFHINWGWGGMSDGYYLLDALNPDEFGIGGTAGGFNLGQQVMLGISPKPLNLFQHSILQLGSVEGKISNEILSLSLTGDGEHGFQYIDPAKINVTFGLEISNISNPQQSVQYYSLNPAYQNVAEGTTFRLDNLKPEIDLKDLTLTDGDTYNFTLTTLIESSDSKNWVEVVAMPGKSNKVSVVKNGDGYEITNYSEGTLEVSDFKILNSTIYQNLPLKLSATFTNSNDISLTRNYSVVFFNEEGTELYKTENYSVNVDADSSLDQDWTSVQWYKENGASDITSATAYTVKLYDNWEGNYVPGIELKVTVEPQPKDNKVEGYISVVGVSPEDDVYVVDSTNFEASVTVKVIEGYFTSTINLGIEVPLSDGSYYTLMHQHFDAVPDLAAGQEQTWTMEMSLPDAQPGKLYRLQAWSDGEFMKPVYIRFNLPDSVQALSPDADGNFVVFSISGVKVLSTNDAARVKSLPHGLYIVNGKKIKI